MFALERENEYGWDGDGDCDYGAAVTTFMGCITHVVEFSSFAADDELRRFWLVSSRRIEQAATRGRPAIELYRAMGSYSSVGFQADRSRCGGGLALAWTGLAYNGVDALLSSLFRQAEVTIIHQTLFLLRASPPLIPTCQY